MVNTIWLAKEIDNERVNILKDQLKISPLLSRLLVAREISEPHLAQAFLQPTLKNLTEPLLFKDMDKAVLRISDAIINNERIGIFGDYDVDGVCSSAILQQFLQAVSAQVFVTLPHRLTEGYGLSRVGIERLKAAQVSVLITADCGILAHEEIIYANEQGLLVIVLDHHNVSDCLPNAFAVVNPKRPDCNSRADYLCAAGVAFFLCMALRRHLREQNFFIDKAEPDLRHLLDLVALATVCDVVPLLGDNRPLVSMGLKVLKKQGRLGLKALMNACNVDHEKISSTNLAFHLGPRINAKGRLGDALYALRLLNCQQKEEAYDLASSLDCDNIHRRDIEDQTVKEACLLIEKHHLHEDSAIVLHDETWHPGVVGIVASRIADRYHRPAIIIGQNGKGSGRSIRGIDLHDMVFRAKQSLAGFGGHSHAIGLTLGPEGVQTFRRDLLMVIKDLVAKTTFDKLLYYDVEFSISDINLDVIDDMLKLEPFGAKNPYPVIRLNHCFMRNLRRLEGGHIKGELENSHGTISYIGFRMDIPDDLASRPLDILGVLEKNEWRGNITPQLRLIDYKMAPVIPAFGG